MMNAAAFRHSGKSNLGNQQRLFVYKFLSLCPHLTPAAQSHASYSRHNRHSAGLDRADNSQQIGRAAHCLSVSHLLDIGPCAEGMSIVASRNYDTFYGRVVLRLHQAVEDAHAHAIAERIQRGLA